jgi:hypothetical protein
MAPEQLQVNFTQAINELANRLRLLEGKQNLFSEKLIVMNTNMIEEYKKVVSTIKALNEDRKRLEGDVSNLKNVIKHLTEEASKFAREDKVKELQKYIEMWNPLHFVTESEVKLIIERTLKEQAKGKKHKKVKKEAHHTIHHSRSPKKTINEVLD